MLLGFLGPIGPALVLSVMVVATVVVHWKNGLFATGNGIEVTLLYATAMFLLALTGPGAFSLDRWLALERLWSPGVEWGAIVVGIAAGLVNLWLRHPAAAVSPASPA